MTIIKDKNYDWQHLVSTYKKIVNPDMEVVEVGSSNPDRTVDLSRYCKKLIGVEKFLERIPKNLASVNNIKIVKGDWLYLSKIVSPNSIDIIVSSHVVEHVKDDLECLDQSFEVLKNGGYLLFNTPNRKRLTRSIIEVFTGERKFPYWEHIREYTRKDLEELITGSKFSLSKAKITGLVLGIHSGIRLFFKRVPFFLDKFSNFWGVLIQK